MPLTIRESNDGIILKRSDIAAWRDELKELANERDRIDMRMEEIGQKIDLATQLDDILRPRPALGLPIQTKPQSEETLSLGVGLPEAIEQIIATQGGIVTNAEIKEKLAKIPEHAERLEKSPNYFYTALKRLRDREKIFSDDRGHWLNEEDHPA